MFARPGVEFPPERAQQLGHVAEQDLGSFDHGVTGRAEGDQQVDGRAAGPAVMDGEHGIDRGGRAAAATMLVPCEDLFPEPGKVFPVGPLPVVAPPAQTAHIYRGRTAAAEKHPLPQAGAPGSHFPSLPRFAFPAHGGAAGRIVRSFCRLKPVSRCT